MFKKLTLFVLFSGLAPLSAQAGLNVFACEPEWAQLATELGGEHVTVHSPTTAYQDPHYIQARPSLISKLRRTDLLVCTGAELEIGWLPVLLERASNPKVMPGELGHFMAADHVQLLEKLDRVDSTMGHVHAAGNPHFQTDPRRMLQVAEVLADRLAVLDSDNRLFYKERFEVFQRDLKSHLSRWANLSTTLKGMPIVVHHNSWVYMNNWLGLSQLATLEPKPGVPPSTAHLNQLLDQMKEHKADAIIYAAYQNAQGAKWLSDKTGIPQLQIHSTVLSGETMTDFYQRLIGSFLKLKE